MIIDRSEDAVARFKRLAEEVWKINPAGKDDKTTALEGLEAMESWMRKLGMAMNISECGGKEEDIEKYADATYINTGGYYVLTRKDIIDIFRKSLAGR